MVCHQEEADTRLVLHLSTLPSNSNAVIRSSDTDVMAVLLGNIHKLKPDVNIWMETGLQSKNTLRYIDISGLAHILGESLCRSLPGFHSFTGCDFSPAFSRKGKKLPLLLLQKNEKWQHAFASLGSSPFVSCDVIEDSNQDVSSNQINAARGDNPWIFAGYPERNIWTTGTTADTDIHTRERVYGAYVFWSQILSGR